MSYDLHNRIVVKTRKDHKCEGCFETLPKGTELTYCKGRWQGDFYSYYMCDPCLNYMDSEMDVSNEGFTPGEIGMYRKEASV